MLISLASTHFYPNLDCKITKSCAQNKRINSFFCRNEVTSRLLVENNKNLILSAKKGDGYISIAVKTGVARFYDISMKTALVLHLPKAIPRSQK